jgi:hypothetical protein
MTDSSDLDDQGPITLGEIRAARAHRAETQLHREALEQLQRRGDRHRRDIGRLYDAVLALARHTDFPITGEAKPTGGKPDG